MGTPRLEEIRSLLESSKKKMMLYHTDVDGLCSASLMLRFYDGFETIPREGPVTEDKFVKEIISKSPDLLVVLDIPIDQEQKKVKRILEECPGTRMLIMDHHVPDADMNSGRIIHLNPRFGSNEYKPASVMVYELMEELGHDVEKLIWIAAMGVIGDYAFRDCEDILDECKKAYPSLIGKEGAMESRLKTAAGSVMSSLILHGRRGVVKSLGILMKSDDPGPVLSDKYLEDCNDKVNAEIRRILDEFKRKAREYPELDLFMFRIDSRLNIASTISTILASANPDKILIISKYSGDMVKISSRYQKGDISLNDLMKKCVAGIGSGGGHEKAAGAVVGKAHWPEFHKRLLEEVRRMKG